MNLADNLSSLPSGENYLTIAATLNLFSNGRKVLQEDPVSRAPYKAPLGILQAEREGQLKSDLYVVCSLYPEIAASLANWENLLQTLNLDCTPEDRQRLSDDLEEVVGPILEAEYTENTRGE